MVGGMRDDANLQDWNARTSGKIPSYLCKFSNYLSANVSSIVSSVRLAGTSVSSSITRPEDARYQVQWAGFDKLELGAGNVRRVLLLGYMNGFQVIDVEEADKVQELVSKRDGPVTFLQMQPRPVISEATVAGFQAASPLLLFVTGDATVIGGNVQAGFGSGYNRDVGSLPQAGSCNFVPAVLYFYSLKFHNYVHALRFCSAIYVVRCSPRIVAVALAAQIDCFDAVTLQKTFTVATYPILGGPGGVNIGYGPMAVGPRWLAYPANDALVPNTGRVYPRHPSAGVVPSTSPASGSLLLHYAKESTKQIAAGIVTLGDVGYRTLTKYYHNLHVAGSASSNGSASTSCQTDINGFSRHACEPDYAGMVIVKDFVSDVVVAQFRAHASPLSALCFDPSGTLLVTASVCGNNLNVFRIMPSAGGNGLKSAGGDWNVSYVHLYKLYRGVTTAVIQDISFSDCSQWIAISSSRGTCHLYAILPFGGVVGTNTHGVTSPRLASALPWWSSSELWRVNQEALLQPPPPTTQVGVSRISNGNGRLLNMVTSAAAVATGRSTCPSGPVAVVFRNGDGHCLQSDGGNFSSRNELWVFSLSGHLIQHTLCPSTRAEVEYCNGIVTGSSGQRQVGELQVVIEAVQSWDVCRKQNWIEREENIANYCVVRTVSEGTHMETLADYKKGSAVTLSAVTGRSVKDGIRTDEKHCQYLSNAEVQTHVGRPAIWEKSQFHFHVMMLETVHEKCNDQNELGGYIEIEKIQTREVEFKRKAVVPVSEHLQISKQVGGGRDLVSESLSDASNLQITCSSSGRTCNNENYFGERNIPRWNRGGACNMQMFEAVLPLAESTKSHLLHDCHVREKDLNAGDIVDNGPVHCESLVTDGQTSTDKPSGNQSLSREDILDTIN